MGCCPSKSRRGGSDAERADQAEASAAAAAEGAVFDVAVGLEPPASCAGSGGAANETAAASTPATDAKRRASVKAWREEDVLGPEEEETKSGEEEQDDAFDEDPRAHLIHASTTERSDCGDRAQFQLDASKFPSNGGVESPASLALALRSPARTPVNYEDMPISSTYHRVLSATIADKEAKRKEEERLEAEQREREVQEYKAAMMLQV